MPDSSVRFGAVRIRREREHDRRLAAETAGAEFPPLSQVVDEEVDLSRFGLERFLHLPRELGRCL